MPLFLLGLDHTTAPVEIRERLAFRETDIPQALQTLVASPAITEAALLSTCNRVEVVLYGDDPRAMEAAALGFLSAWHRLPRTHFVETTRSFTEEAAAEHLFSVAAGLESLVPGEKQILGQVKQAGQLARDAGTLGKMLTRLFDAAVACGRRVRHETEIARHPVSVSHAAVALVREHLRDLEGRHVLLIGGGKMIEVAAKQLHDLGATHFTIANRTLARACELAQQWGGDARPLDAIPTALVEADVVISATAAPHLVVYAETVAAAMQQRQGRPLLLVDLAVPRDIDPLCADIDDVTLVDVDGLRDVVNRSMQLRLQAREEAAAIVREEVRAFMEWYAVQRVAPTLAALRQKADAIKQAELERALRRLGDVSPHERKVLETLVHNVVNKLLAAPTVQLRQRAVEGDGDLYAQVLSTLFELPQAEGSRASEQTV